jgi:competence protein CoiA
MQLFAYEGSTIIFAEEGIKGRIYRCPECSETLGVKEGPHRRKHFFHISPRSTCRQHVKDETHLVVQQYIYSLLPRGEAKLEHPFPSIHRIADVAWLHQKIVFEVQCSPISLKEVQERMHDYESKGFSVIWILHDKRFNKKNLSAAETFLRNSSFSSYFTSLRGKGEGLLYDQFEILRSGRRTFKTSPLPIQINRIAPLAFLQEKNSLPQCVQIRLSSLPYYFRGDLLDRIYKNPSYAGWMLKIEKKNSLFPSLSWKKKFLRMYQFLFYSLLCR